MLRPEVVGHEPIVAAESGELVRAGLHGEQRREVETRDPALRSLVQRRSLRRGHFDAGLGQEPFGLGVAQRELRRAKRQQASRRAQTREGKPLLTPAGEHELRPIRKMLRDRLERIDAVAVSQLVDVVEHEHHRLPDRSQGGAEARKAHGPQRIGARCCSTEDARVHRPDPVRCGGQIRQKGGRVVVAVVQRDPGEGPRVVRRPLREERRLAVAGRRRDADHPRARRGAEAADECGAADEPVTELGHLELRLEQFERGRFPPRFRGSLRGPAGFPPGARRRLRSWIAHSAQSVLPVPCGERRADPRPSV